jgi:D-xylose 1-dehydrogenase (NADP+, D-xylono-1,5-lactone-forming)
VPTARSSDVCRWGLAGTALINRRLIPAFRAARRSSLVAVASRDADRARAYAQEWQIEKAHGGYDALLRDSEIDAVYIPLPNSLHVEWTLRALDAGKHVLCEKPLALTPEDVDRVIAVSRARERIAAEAFMYRHEPLIQRVRELVQLESIGPIKTISSGFAFELNRPPTDARHSPELGGGSLWDVGCYAVSVARFVTGADPVAVFGWATPSVTGVDESFTGLLRFPAGAVATIHSSFRSSFRTWLEIGGKDGSIRVANPFKPGPREEIELQRGDQVQRIGVEGSPMQYVREIEDFVASALDGRPPVVSLLESRGNAAALAALHESARRSAPVSL